MNDLSKEEILKKVIPNYKSIEQWNVVLRNDFNDTFSPLIFQAMQEYADQEKKKETISFEKELNDIKNAAIRQSDIATDRLNERDQTIEELKKEIERLKGLIEKLYKYPFQMAYTGARQHQEEQWQQFKIENNL